MIGQVGGYPNVKEDIEHEWDLVSEIGPEGGLRWRDYVEIKCHDRGTSETHW